MSDTRAGIINDALAAIRLDPEAWDQSTWRTCFANKLCRAAGYTPDESDHVGPVAFRGSQTHVHVAMVAASILAGRQMDDLGGCDFPEFSAANAYEDLVRMVQRRGVEVVA